MMSFSYENDEKMHANVLGVERCTDGIRYGFHLSSCFLVRLLIYYVLVSGFVIKHRIGYTVTTTSTDMNDFKRWDSPSTIDVESMIVTLIQQSSSRRFKV